MSYTPKSREWWELETIWIERESKKEIRMAAFNKYCTMQATFAKKDGFQDLATRIRKANKGAQ